MNKPYVICHMTTSINNKVTGNFLEEDASESALELYYEKHRNYKADAFACGRVTMDESFTKGNKPYLAEFAAANVPREDYIADPDAEFYAVAFDRKGRLGWKSSKIEDDDPGYNNAHIIEVMCEDAPQTAYLAYLRSIGVSYIFAGKFEMDLPLALEKLKNLFGIEKLLLEGGSIINGAFHREGLIDELSLVVAPVMAASEDKPLFDKGRIDEYQMLGIKKYNEVLWLNYKK